jgi:hypothetical protein
MFIIKTSSFGYRKCGNEAFSFKRLGDGMREALRGGWGTKEGLWRHLARLLESTIFIYFFVRFS